MAYRSPFGQAFADIGQAFANALTANQKTRTEDAAALSDEKKTRSDAINVLLSNPSLPSGNRAQLQELLGRINAAQSVEDLRNLPAAYSDPFAANPSTPAALNAAVFSAGPAQTPSQVVGGAVAAGATGAQALKDKEAARQLANKWLLPVLTNTNLPPETRQNALVSFLASAPPDTLLPGERGLAEAMAGVNDPIALADRVAKLRETQAHAGSAEAQQKVDARSLQSRIDKLASDAAAEKAAADLAASNARVAVSTEGARTTQANAAASSASTAAKLAAGEAPFRLREAKLTADKFAEQLSASIVNDKNQAKLDAEKLKQIQQTTQQAGVTFKQGQQDASLKRIDAAYQSGYDQNLTPQEKQGLAAYIATTSGFPTQDVPVGGSTYTGFLHKRASDNLSAYNLSLEAKKLSNDVKRTGLKLTDAQIKVLHQQFNIKAYNFGRDQTLNDFKDSNSISTYLFNGMQAGDTNRISTYLTYLKNPDLYPDQAKQLQGWGFSKAGLEGMLKAAEQQSANLTATDAAKLSYLQAQGKTLAAETQDRRVATLQSLAKSVPDASFIDKYAQDLKTSGGWTESDITAFKAFASGDTAIKAMGAAAQEVTALTENPQPPANFSAWEGTFVNAAKRAGMSENTAKSVADGFVNAWKAGDFKDKQDLLLSKAKLALLGAEAQKYAADVAAGKNPAQPSAAQALSNARQYLKDASSTTWNMMVDQACVIPAQTTVNALGQLMAQATGGKGRLSDSKECKALSARYTMISDQQLQAAGSENIISGAPLPKTTGATPAAAPASSGSAKDPKTLVKIGVGNLLNIKQSTFDRINTNLATNDPSAVTQWVAKQWGITTNQAKVVVKAAQQHRK